MSRFQVYLLIYCVLDVPYLMLKVHIQCLPKIRLTTLKKLFVLFPTVYILNLVNLDIACHNRHIPLYVIKYMVENGADMYHFYEVNGYKTHVLQEMNRSETITHIYISNGFVMKQMQEQLAVLHKRYK